MCLAVAANAAPNLPPGLPKFLKALPTVGEIYGPAVTVNAPDHWSMKDNVLYITVDPTTEITMPITPGDQFFTEVKEMKSYVRNSLTDELAVIEIDPYELNGKYLEVLWSKAVPSHASKLICHYPSNTTHPFCKNLKVSNLGLKLTYSMVRLVGDHNTVFPIVFVSHKGCIKDMPCFWFSHPTEIAVLDKSII